MNLSYRIWQFRKSFQAPPSDEDWAMLRFFLSPVETLMFTRLPVPDQNHSLRVFKSLRDAGETDPDLLKTALLHDIGKSLHPLKRWERVFSILFPFFAPRLAEKWAEGEPRGIKRPLVVLAQHPRWGAELLRDAACSDAVVWLIENHEKTDPLPEGSPALIETLRKFQEIDNLN